MTNLRGKVNTLKGVIPSAIENPEKIANLLNSRMKNRLGGNNQRLAIMLGWLTSEQEIKAKQTDTSKSIYSQEKYKYLLFAPFSISQKCCEKMKKSPAHKYQKTNKQNPFTAQMAIESRLRLQKWLQHGCNIFDAKNPISNPMSFWTEQDVLKYIHDNNIKIASVYGDIVVKNTGLQGQINIHDYLQDYRECNYETTGCDRTGCMFCGYGCHLEKRGKGRFELMAVTHPKLYDYVMRGGAFDTDGLWKPTNNGLGYWFVLKWINIHGGFNIVIPNYEYYEKKYGNEITHYYLYEQKGEING